jgi:hypothetical protein
LLAAILFLFLGSGGFFLWFGIYCCQSLVGWVIASVGIAVSLGLPVVFFATMLRRKLTKGHWLLTLDERHALHARAADQPPSRFSKVVGSPWYDFVLAPLMLFPVITTCIRAYHQGKMGGSDAAICVLWLLLACLYAWMAVRKLRRSVAAG